MIKKEWFQNYTPESCPQSFDYVFQSWDTASKVTELSDFSVCTTWGRKGKYLYLLHVYRKKMDYPTLKTRGLRPGPRMERHNNRDRRYLVRNAIDSGIET